MWIICLQCYTNEVLIIGQIFGYEGSLHRINLWSEDNQWSNYEEKFFFFLNSMILCQEAQTNVEV